MTLFVKICGINDPTGAQAAVAAGADAVGFVFADSPRQVTPDQARVIAADLPVTVARVAVFRRPSPARLANVLGDFAADVVQADHEYLAGFEFPAVLPVYREPTTDIPQRTRFLYEGPKSGVGRRVDLDRAALVARSGEMVLAGGLDSHNVAAVIESVKPFGVDVSSGVETSPGVKSPALIRSFVTAARAAAERLVTT